MENKILEFTQALLDYLETLEKEPIALKLAAPEGWRFSWGKFDEISGTTKIFVETLREWGFLAPNLKLLEPEDYGKIMNGDEFLLQDSERDFFLEEARNQLPFMWPVSNSTGTLIIKNLYAVYGPNDTRSNEEITQEISEYFTKTVESVLAPSVDVFPGASKNKLIN